MSRPWKIAVAILTLFVVVGLLSIPALVRSVLGLRRVSATEEQARNSLIQAPISTPTDRPAIAQLFWASPTSPATLEPNQVELPLSADPVERAKQLIAALITQAPTPAQSTLPADATLLQFYLLPDGTAVADFSDALGTETPSGILSERLAVDSIVSTLGAGVSQVHQLKILIHGQETDTLAGHLDLTGFFPVVAPESSAPVASPVAPPLPAGPPPSAEQTSPAPSAQQKAAPASTPAPPATKPSAP
jgi:Sporulation and spore germination